jgi:uncharacterized protein (DUF302 family)
MKNIKIIVTLTLLFSTQLLSAQESENYYFIKTVKGSFEGITEKVIDELTEQGFGIVTEIDLENRIKNKLGDVEINPYKILGPCIAEFAYEAYKLESNIGLFIPCKVLIKDVGNNTIEVVMINPVRLLNIVENKELEKVAKQVKAKYLAILENL